MLAGGRRDALALLMLPVAAYSTSVLAEDYLTPPEAQILLFPGATDFETLSLELDKGQRNRIRSLSGVKQRDPLPRVQLARREGRELGWFVVDEVIGKHEFITHATALSPDGQVIGVEILSYRETHGGEVRRASWREHFQGKTLADEFALDVDVPNISGATLSCRNLLDGVKRLLALQAVVRGDE